jgi:hypothetical protein
MTDGLRARVKWVPHGEGGRKAPPAGVIYSTVARFEAIADRWPSEAWSVVLDLSQVVPGEYDVVVPVRALMFEATDTLLVPGAKFDLFEGRRRVAAAEVLK